MNTGSLFNNLMGASRPPVPAVGMGATRLMYTDRVACTIVEVLHGGKVLVAQEDIATRADSNGMSDAQAYTYAPNPQGRKHGYSLRKNGAYVRAGQSQRSGERLLIGSRHHYHDYSF